MRYHKLSRFIFLKHIVLKVWFDSAFKKFFVQIQKASTSEIFTQQYDYVIVANGKYSKPFIPQIPGKF